MESEQLKAALLYQKIKYSVIPIRQDKKPFIPWAKYQTDRADENTLREWWANWPGANIGLVTGEVSGIDVVDCDSQAGVDALNEFLPDTLLTPIAETPKGYHYYFKHRKGLSNGVRILNDCDLRTDGGYIIAPPSNNGKGKAYKWKINLTETDPVSIPEMLFSVLQAGNSNTNVFNSTLYKGSPPQVVNRPPLSSKVVIDFQKGSRDNSLFHVANYLVRGGMPVEEIQQLLALINLKLCNPPLPDKEILAKIESALKRSKGTTLNLNQEVQEWVLSSSGVFLSSEVANCLQLSSRPEKKNLSKVLGRLVDEKIIERTGKKNAQFRRIENDCETMDFFNATTETVKLWLPFNLDDMIEIMPGNIILVAGAANAGKTAFLLNIIKENMNNFKIHYFNSEMGSSELRKRLDKFSDIMLDQWHFKAWERSDNFGAVIKPGKGKINIIDFLEIHDDFYKIGGYLKAVHDRLKGAIAIIAVQKNVGLDVGLGGQRTLEKPRLALAMDSGILKVVKAKNWKTEKNPNGLKTNFKLVNGCKFIQQGKWA